MDPVFFPFSYLSAADMEVMRIYFQRVVVAMPSRLAVPDHMAALEREGSLTIRVPGPVRETELAAVLKSFRAWAELHGSRGMAHLKNTGGEMPFFDESNPSRIRNAIRSGGGEKPVQESDSRFEAAVFMQTALELDWQNADVFEQLDRVRRREEQLFEDLLSEEPGISRIRQSAGGEDRGAFMTRERMQAWSRMMAGQLGEPTLLVTTSRGVFDWVWDRLAFDEDSPSTFVTPMPTPSWTDGEGGGRAFTAALEELASRDFDGGAPQGPPRCGEGSPQDAPALCLVADEGPNRFVSRFCETSPGSPAPDLPMETQRHTLVACVDTFRCRPA